MKTLKDGTNVSSRLWYYLLDFLNDQQANGLYEGVRLREMGRSEFFKLFQEATTLDANNI